MKLPGYKVFNLLKIAQDMSGQPPSDDLPQGALPSLEQDISGASALTDEFFLAYGKFAYAKKRGYPDADTSYQEIWDRISDIVGPEMATEILDDAALSHL
jgi:hypothetical protein